MGQSSFWVVENHQFLVVPQYKAPYYIRIKPQSKQACKILQWVSCTNSQNTELPNLYFGMESNSTCFFFFLFSFCKSHFCSPFHLDRLSLSNCPCHYPLVFHGLSIKLKWDDLSSGKTQLHSVCHLKPPSCVSFPESGHLNFVH